MTMPSTDFEAYVKKVSHNEKAELLEELESDKLIQKAISSVHDVDEVERMKLWILKTMTPVELLNHVRSKTTLDQRMKILDTIEAEQCEEVRQLSLKTPVNDYKSVGTNNSASTDSDGEFTPTGTEYVPSESQSQAVGEGKATLNETKCKHSQGYRKCAAYNCSTLLADMVAMMRCKETQYEIPAKFMTDWDGYKVKDNIKFVEDLMNFMCHNHYTANSGPFVSYLEHFARQLKVELDKEDY